MKKLDDIRRDCREDERYLSKGLATYGYDPDVRTLLDYIDDHVEFTADDLRLISAALSFFENAGQEPKEEIDALNAKIDLCLGSPLEAPEEAQAVSIDQTHTPTSSASIPPLKISGGFRLYDRINS